MRYITLLVTLLCFSFYSQAQVEYSFETIKKLPAPVNSGFEETQPVFDLRTNQLYFTRSLYPDNTGGPQSGQDIWVSTKQGSQWSEPTNALPGLNNQLNNTVLGISENSDTFYLLSTYEKKINLQKGFSTVKRAENSWSIPEKIEVSGLNIKSDFYSGFVDQTGKVMIISMDGKQSKGQEDLYISIKTLEGWSKPMWLGDSINSSGYEISPFLCDDGITLLFASNGHPGKGDCDIFYAYRLDSTWTNWSKPKNMESLNSEAFDAYAYQVDDQVFFASSRNDSFSNIYSAINTSFFRVADTMRLAFMMNNMRLSNVSVDVIDEEGQNVGTYSSGNNTTVKIDNLKQGFNYTFKPSHEEVDVNLFSPFVLNENDEPIEQMVSNDDGSYGSIAKSAEDNQEAEVLPEPEFVRGMSGIFELDGVPVRNVIIALTDESGFPTQYSATNEGGRFEFAETPDSMELFIEVVTELEYMRQNGTIFFTDENGTKLFKAGKVGVGQYKYQKLEAQELAKLKMLSEIDSDESKATSAGVFKYQDLPREGVKMYLVDANDNIVETVVTDADGKFEFSKLQADKGFRIKLADESDVSLQDSGMVYFMDENGNELNVMNSAGANGYEYKPLRSELSLGLSLLEEEDASSMMQHYVFSVGVFEYQNLPKEGITLQLLDENDNVIETVTTDINGQFVFSMLRPDADYKVRVVSENPLLLDESEMYFVSKDGKVITAANEDKDETYAFNRLNPDYFFSINQLNEGETKRSVKEGFDDFSGQFKYQDLPKEGVKLYLMDENNKVIETVYTDADGNFKFSKLAKESNFFVKVAEEDASLLDAASFVMTDANNQPIEQTGIDDSGFSFKTLPRSAESLAGINEEDGSSLNIPIETSEQEEPKSREVMDIQGSGGELYDNPEFASILGGKNDLVLNTTSFHFNSVRLSDRDRNKLNETIRQVLKTNQPILIVGYSCDLGDRNEREAVATARAEEVEKYMVNMGVPQNRIEISAVFDALDGVENPTTDQRVENRKVEVYHLAP